MHEPPLSGGTVRRLWVGEAELYRQHLLRFDAESRRNRFGGAVSDEFIGRYAQSELRLLEHAGDAEAALSVERAWQSRGVGTALLERVLLAARNRQVGRLHMLCLAENRRMQHLARKFDAALSFEAGSVMGEMKAPDPTPMSVMRERVVDGTDLATAMLDVPSQLAKRLDSMNGPPERRRRDRRYERLMLVDNWR